MDVDRLVEEVNRITGAGLQRSDPILAASVINEILLNEALAKLDRQMKTQIDRATAASDQTVGDAKREAEALLSNAGDWIEKRIKEAGQEAAAAVLASLRQETAKAERASRLSVRVAWTTAVIGLAILSGLGGMTLAGLGHP